MMEFDEIRGSIPSIWAEVKPRYNRAFVWYNFYLMKMDLEFVEPKDASLPELVLSFEHGHPAYAQQMQAYLL